jgi:hypothetical protein
MNDQATQTEPTAQASQTTKPGTTVAPQNSAITQPQPTTISAPPQPRAGAPSLPSATPTPKANIPQPEAQPISQSVDGSVSWTASEYVAHDKSPGWYALVVLAALVLAAIIFLLTKDKISTGVVVAVGIAFAGYGARKPRQLQYVLNDSGLSIGDKHYGWGHFRSFAVIDEGAFSNILFMPLKRFSPLITVYYDPKDEAKIMPLLSDRLPMEDRDHDVVDRLMHRIRF